jgi:hypothetical protein
MRSTPVVERISRFVCSGSDNRVGTVDCVVEKNGSARQKYKNRRLMVSARNVINRRQFCTLTTSALLALKTRPGLGATVGLEDRPPLSSTNNQLVLWAPLGNPFYVWPRTLLAYPIEAGAQLSTGSHRLLCVETNERVPFQVSMTGASDASELLFFSDLPYGATRTYRLDRSASAHSDVGGNVVIVTRDGNSVTINSGPIQVRIPSSQTVAGLAPGPILGVSRDGKWTGQSNLTVPGRPIASIHTEELEAGPLRSTHRVTYTFADGAKYVATVQCFAGVDFVRLHEDMESISADAQGQFDFAWDGCQFDYRQMANHPYNFPQAPLPKYKSYPWETIAPVYMDNQFGVAPGVDSTGKIPFNLRIYEPWQDHAAASYANFWGDNSADAAAIFIDHMEQWEDHEYAIWHSSSRIAVDFVYKNSTLHFVWRIARGTRSTCIAFYDHAKDVEAMRRLERDYRGIETSGGKRFKGGIYPTSYALELQGWHGTLNLDKTKDWVLTYPENAARPELLFKESESTSAGAFYNFVASSSFLSELALSGTRQNHGFGPTASRQLLESWIPGYQRFRSQLSADQRQRIEAILLLLAYVHAGEDYMPMQRMLSGHPNFLSDVKSTPPGMAFLFPEHPAADAWADEWEAYFYLNTRYHTRPEVEAWNARGGRWTENLGTYVWAFLRPASRAAFLLKARDGHQRLCSPQLVEMSDWLVNALSAPFAGESPATMKHIADESARDEGAKRHYWGIVSPNGEARRVHPPMGAHSERRKTPRMMWYLGTALKNYSPLIAEHLMWAARLTDQDMESTADMADPYGVMVDQPDNRGTNPHLRTAKYTGFGITMRAAVDTHEELSIHLVQIDDGPNYRWGTPSEGSCGVLYFFANGKGYSHNATEDDGDRIDQDTDFVTNFGVWKNKVFRSIGQNVLSRPFYDLTYAQFAEIVPRQGAEAYSWPEYVGRSITLAGDDYFILHDQVFNPEIAYRFSWFVRKGDDFPHITLLNPARSAEDSLFTTIETGASSGKWIDGTGDNIALITHKKGIQAKATSFGGRVTLPDGNDLVFVSQKPLEFQEEGNSFKGTSGIIRNRKDGCEVALFHGTHIAAAGFSFTTRDPNLGISMKMVQAETKDVVEGYFFAPAPSQVEIGLPANSVEIVLYVDGTRIGRVLGERIAATLPAGTHHWELTAGLPVPLAPSIEHIEYSRGGAIIHGTPVASASRYQLELSSDDAKTWQPFAGSAPRPAIALTGLGIGKKYHGRLIASNEEHRSAAGLEYPLYITQDAPPPPDGLHVELSAGSANLTWGEVLGITEYRVYRRKRSEAQFTVAYRGRATTWKDRDPSILAPASSPRDSASNRNAPQPAIEYYLTASNHNGEGRRSRTANTDPASWRNWNPTDGEPFRRTVELTEGQLPNDGGGRYYPK